MRADPTGAALPQIQEAAQRYSENARHKLAGLIHEAGPQGLPFARWMHAALYDPQAGYYAGAPLKFGDTAAAAGTALQGDFVTAPELTPWFGRSLARQIGPSLPISAPLIFWNSAPAPARWPSIYCKPCCPSFPNCNITFLIFHRI